MLKMIMMIAKIIVINYDNGDIFDNDDDVDIMRIFTLRLMINYFITMVIMIISISKKIKRLFFLTNIIRNFTNFLLCYVHNGYICF